MFPSSTPMPSGPLALPNMVNNLASTLNTSALAQNGAANNGGGSAQTTQTIQQPAQTLSQPPAGTANGSPQGGGPTGNLNDVISQIMQQMTSANGAVSSEGASIQDQINKAIQAATTSTNASNSAITGYYGDQSKMMQAQMGIGLGNANNNMGTGGLAQNALSLKMINDDNTQSLEALNAQMTSAIASNNNSLQQTLSNLIGQQMSLTLQAKQDVVQNIASMGSTVGSLSQAGSAAQQAATAQAQQEEQAQNDVANLATKYGVSVQPGWTLKDVINAVQPKANEQESLNLQGMATSIQLQKAQTALTSAQAAAANVIWNPTQLSDMYAPIVAAGGPATPYGKQAVANLMTVATNNPQNFANLSAQVAQTLTPHVWDQSDLQSTALYYRGQGMSIGDALENIVTNNPSIENKTEATSVFRQVYGAPAVLTGGQLLGAAMNEFLAPAVTFGSGGPGQNAFIQQKSSQFQLANPTLPNPYPGTSQVQQ